MSIPLVLINGWAMPEAALAPLATRLTDIDVTIINLSDVPVKMDDFTLSTMVQLLHTLLPDTPFVLAGWSYGGTLACAYASTFPDKVKALVTLATNPCFVAKADWPSAMNPSTFDEFLTVLNVSPQKALGQFSLLCSLGSKDKKQLGRHLKKLLTTSDSMTRILTLLGLADIRRQLANIRCPVTHCYGKQDTLVPSTIVEEMLTCFKSHNTHIDAGGHCFFIDNPDSVATLLKTYCQGGCHKDG